MGALAQFPSGPPFAPLLSPSFPFLPPLSPAFSLPSRLSRFILFLFFFFFSGKREKVSW